MRSALMLATFVLATGEVDAARDLMLYAFYPTLLGILVIASLGIPIPEDIPLIAAGVILRTHPETASWHGTFMVALVGIMTGDLILYSMGRRWGPDVVNHRFVRWMVSPKRYEQAAASFRKHGAWFCFFGRFFVGIRAMMCMTAGATRFPYWRFFLADCAGAVLSIPFFVVLGYAFAYMLPTLRSYIAGVQSGMLVVAGAGVLAIGLYLYLRRRRRRAALLAAAAVDQAPAGELLDVAESLDTPDSDRELSEAESAEVLEESDEDELDEKEVAAGVP